MSHLAEMMKPSFERAFSFDLPVAVTLEKCGRDLQFCPGRTALRARTPMATQQQVAARSPRSALLAD